MSTPNLDTECANNHAGVYQGIDLNADPMSKMAAGLINFFSNHVSKDVVEEIGNFLFARSPFDDAAFDLLTSQPSFLIIFWFGILLSVLSIAGAILLLIPSTRNWSTKKVSSQAMNTAGLVLAVVSLIFIVIGTGFYPFATLASSLFYSGGHFSSMTVAQNNVQTFMLSKDENACFARATFEPYLNQTAALPQKVINDFEQSSGLQAAMEFNVTELGKELTASSKGVDQILADLNLAAKNDAIIKNDEAADQVNDAIKGYRAINEMLAPYGVPNDLSVYGKKMANFKNNLEQTMAPICNRAASSATSGINNVYIDVNRTIDTVATAMNVTASMVNHVTVQINSAIQQLAYTTDDNDLIRTIVTILVFVIMIFAVIVAIVAIIYGSVYITRKSSASSEKTGCTLFTLAIILLALTSFVMAPTLLNLVYGYSVQASCQPFFYDDNFKGLETMALRLPKFTISAIDGGSVVTMFTDVMETCKLAQVPFFSAVANNHEILDKNRMGNAVNYKKIMNQFDLDMSTTNIIPIDKQAHDDTLASIYALQYVPFLDIASAAAPDAIEIVTKDIISWRNDLLPTLYQCANMVDDTDKLLSSDDIIAAISKGMDKSLKDIDQSYSYDAGNLYNALYKSGESCSNLYGAYQMAGDAACKQPNDFQVQKGTWLATGLAVLFFIPLALALTCIGNAYRHGKAADGEAPRTHNNTTVPVSPAPVAHHQPAARGAPVPPTRNQAAAPAVPTHSSHQHQQKPQWAPAYLPPPQHTSQFLDPLAYPSGASGTPAYAGGPVNGYYAAPATRH